MAASAWRSTADCACSGAHRGTLLAKAQALDRLDRVARLQRGGHDHHRLGVAAQRLLQQLGQLRVTVPARFISKEIARQQPLGQSRQPDDF
jgi:hypothetical protein